MLVFLVLSFRGIAESIQCSTLVFVHVFVYREMVKSISEVEDSDVEEDCTCEGSGAESKPEPVIM